MKWGGGGFEVGGVEFGVREVAIEESDFLRKKTKKRVENRTRGGKGGENGYERTSQFTG